MINRRRFLRLTAGTAVGIGSLGGFPPFSPLTAAEAAVTPDLVRMRPEIVPLLKLIETTPRDQCVAMLAGQLRQDVPFRELMAAAFFHAMRHDGHHTVYLVHAALQLSSQALSLVPDRARRRHALRRRLCHLRRARAVGPVDDGISHRALGYWPRRIGQLADEVDQR